MCATGIGQVKLRAGQVEVADMGMMYVGYPFGVAHLGVFPELGESFIAAG